MGASPIGQYESFKLTIPFQKIGKQIFVLAGVIAIKAVVGAHHARRIGLLYANLEREQVALARGALVDVHVDGVAPALLIVEREMLDVAKHMLRLNAFDYRGNHLAGQYRI